MAEILIKRDDVVYVHNMTNNTTRHSKYIGKVISIVPNKLAEEVNEFLCSVVGKSSPLNARNIRIKIKPYYRIDINEKWHNNSIPTIIEQDLIYLEHPIDVEIITPEKYLEMRVQFLSKLNVISNLIYGADEFRLEELFEKPKPFSIK